MRAGALSHVVVVALIAAAVHTAPALAQRNASVRGQVVDAKTRNPVANADVSAEGTTRVGRSGSDGAFRVDGLSFGTYTLRVRRIGYATSTVVVSASGGREESIVVVLTEAARELDAVVVTAARREQKLKDVVSSTELISRRDIEATGASNIGAVLTQQTGIQFTGGHPSGSGVALEGMSDQRVLILVDGLPMYGRVAGGMDLTRIPSSAVERVEVVKGPQSTLYGSEAMGGVINIITREAALATSDAELHQTAGSDRRSDTDLLASLNRGRLSATTNLGHRYIERTAGIAGTSGSLTDRLDGVATARWMATPALSFDANALVLNDRERWPSGSLYQFADNTQANGRIGASYNSAITTVRSTLYVSQLDHLSRASQFTQPIAGTGDRQKQRLEQAEVTFSHRLGDVVIDGGALGRHEFISSTDGRIAGGSRTLNSAEPYAQLELMGARWSVVPGVRVSASDEWGTYVSPRVAARFQATPSVTLRASAGRGYRAPDFKELYLDFTNDAAFYAVHGNLNLRPETSENASVGVEWDGTRVYARGLVYMNSLHDFIETQPLPAQGKFSQYTYGNISSGSTRGGELSSGATLGRIRAEAGYAYLSAIDRSTGGALLGQPKNSGRLLVGTELAFALQVTATGVYTGQTPMERGANGIVSSYRDAYSRLDLRAAKMFLTRYTVSAGVDNLFDARPARWADATARQLYLSAGVQLHPRDR